METLIVIENKKIIYKVTCQEKDLKKFIENLSPNQSYKIKEKK